MVKYDWEILKLVVAPSADGFSNVVTKVNWRYQASENGVFADRYFTTEISSPVEGQDFTSFEKLTDSQVFDWIQENEDIESLKQKLLERLEEEKNPVAVEKNVPWNKTVYTPNDKFIIVVDGDENVTSKTLGPFSWDSNTANSFLKKLGLTYEFATSGIMFSKGILPTTTPLVINERISVYRAHYSEVDFDENYQTVTETQWDTSTGEAIGTHLIQDKSLSVIRNEVKKVLEEEHKNKKVASVSFIDSFTISEVDRENPIEVTDPETGITSYKFETITKVISIDTTVKTTEDVHAEALNKLMTTAENETTYCRVNETEWFLMNHRVLNRLVKEIGNHYDSVSKEKANFLKSIEEASSIAELQSIELSIRET